MSESNACAQAQDHTARERIRSHYSRVRRTQEHSRVSKIVTNLEKVRVHSETVASGKALSGFPRIDTSSPREGDIVSLPRATPPPPGVAWVRARTDLRTPEVFYAGYYVPYLGETEDKFNASQTLAKDLVDVTGEGQEGNDEGDTDDYDMSDVEGVHPMDESRPGSRIARLSWERAAKRVTIKEVVEFGMPGYSMQSLTKPLADVLDLDDDHVARYYGNAKRREAMWQRYDRELLFRERLASGIRGVTESRMRDSAKEELKSDSLSVLFCRQCYTFDCMQHGLHAARPNVTLPDSTRTDSMPASHLRTVQDRCRIVNPGQCWLRREDSAGDLAPISSSPLSQCAKDLVSVLRKNMGNDPCRITEMIRILDSSGSSSTSCYDVGEFLAALEPLSDAKQVRNVKRVRTSVPSPEVKAMRGGRRLDYSPCYHEGACTKQNCGCAEMGVNCEKYCCCNHVRVSGDRTHAHGFCKRAHNGCSCKSAASCRTSNCVCFSSRRECDPDLCKSCGAGNAPGEARACCNAGLRLHSRYKTICGRSKVHGWGVFAVEFIPKGVLVGEYLGEIINQDEAERRGRVYDELNNSFLFNVTERYAVDSTRLGSKLKYCNHSKSPNCEPRLMRVGGDVRVGIYSKRDIPFLEELFFDYGYGQSGPAWANEDSHPGGNTRKSERKSSRQLRASRSGGDSEGDDADDVVAIEIGSGAESDSERSDQVDAEDVERARRRPQARRASLLAMTKLLRNS